MRALAFSTGGGLDFWVLSDRSLDIGPLWWKGTQLAWQAPAGFRSPALTDPDSEDGRGFNRSLSGFLVTCGLDHTRQPVAGHPLHGRLPFTPARVTAYGEDWRAAVPVLYVEGEVTQARFGGEALRLHRRIEAPIGGATPHHPRQGREPRRRGMATGDALPLQSRLSGHQAGDHGRLQWPADHWADRSCRRRSR